MANSILTPTMVTREILRVLHQQSTFLNSITKQYDDSFAKSGAKIGDSLKIRLPNRYTVRSGLPMSAQDTTETSVTLAVSTVKGVDLNFSSQDLTLSLDDFSKRIIAPATAVLAATVESDALNTMAKDIYNVEASSVGTAITYTKVMAARRQLMDNLAPMQDRTALLNTNDNANLITALSALFNDSKSISKQYVDGYMGYAAGMDFMESSIFASQDRGTADGNYLVNAATTANGATSIVVDTGTGTLNVGETFTIANVFRVHPETKNSTGVLQKFVVTAAYAGGGGTISVSPAIYYSGANQNVNSMPANNAAITVTGTASTAYGISMAYHKDAFTFATADLIMPRNADMAERAEQDGLAISLVRDFNIADRSFPARLDILYGYKTLRPETAVRMANLVG